jgi:hypothetical protein
MSEDELGLRRLRLASPSEDLDRRIGAAFGSAAKARSSAPKLSRWWWLLVFAASGAAAELLLVSPPELPRPPVAPVYRIEARGHLRDMLLGTPSRTDNLPRLTVGGDRQ